MSQTTATCRQCGARLSPGESRGLCPACLFTAGLRATDDDATTMGELDAGWLEQQGVKIEPLVTPAAHHFGDYELHEEIGRGGMGVIFRATQLSLQRTVAVKTILSGPLSSPDFVQRFQTEAHAAAVLDHPNIVPIYDVGDHEGQPYYSMRLISGRNLAQVIKQDGPLPARRAATLIATVARAIHYAHQRGVLHRDLKPANILLDADGQPHVTDFGLAKLLEEDDGLTLTQAALGTPNYMAPEQAAGKAADLTTAADTYSLGAILFEALTSQKLFASETPLATINRALDQEPPKPSAILRSVPRDLDTICAKCLEKEPYRRYSSAQALAEDLERWLAGEPILARRVGAIERIGLWCHRKPAMARLAGVALLAVLIASGVATWRVAVARHQKELEQYYGNISLADAYVRDGAIDRAMELLLQCPPKFRHWEWGRLLYMCHQEIASIPAHTNRPQYLLQSLMGGLKVNRDGSRVATRGTDGQLKLWDAFQTSPLFVRGDTNNPVTAWDFSPDGKELAVGSTDGTIQSIDAVTGREVWAVHPADRAKAETAAGASKPRRIIGMGFDTRQDMPIFDLAPQELEAIIALSRAPDGRQLATASNDRVITMRDAATGQELAGWRHGLPKLERLWFTPEGALVVKGPLAVESFESETGRVLATHRWAANEYAALFLDASGRNAATIDHNGLVQLWRDGEKSHALGEGGGDRGLYGQVWFDPTGRFVCTGGEAGKARLHEVGTGRLLFSLPHNVFGAAFSPDGGRLVTFGQERLVRLWDVTRQQELRVLRGHLSVPGEATFSADGNLIATAARDGMVKLWTAAAGRERVLCAGLPWSPTYSPDGRQWAIAPWGTGAYVCDADSGKVVASFPSRRLGVLGMAFSPDGRFLLTAAGRAAWIWDVRERRLAGVLRGHDRPVLSVAWSTDGRWIATGDFGGRVRIWDAATRQERLNLRVQAQDFVGVQFDPLGQKLLTAGFGLPKIWDIKTGQMLWALDDEEGGCFGASFSPDGHSIAGACLDRQIRFWDSDSGRLIERWTSRSQGGAPSYHSPDGRRFVLCVSDMGAGGQALPSIEVWDVTHGRRLLDLQGHTDNMYGSFFSPNGRSIISSSMDMTVRQWESFPWRETEFAACPGKTLPERIRHYAERYWRERLSVEPAAADALPVGEENGGITLEWDMLHPMARTAAPSPNLLNLDSHYTDTLDSIFYPEGRENELDNDLRELPAGEQYLRGVHFDVRALVVLQCRTQDEVSRRMWKRHPVRADGIRVGSKARRVHVLHAAVGEAPASTVIGSYVLHYADGTQHELEIIYGRDLRHWWLGGRGDLETDVSQAQVAWTGSNPVAEYYKASLRLFLRTYNNPRPDVEITSIDFVSKLAVGSAPFLVAITVEP